jgi:pilus assembly protein Flp/PilA
MPYLQMYAKYSFLRARKFFTCKEEGASMGEYAVLLAIVTVALIATIKLYGTAIKGLFTTATSDINSSSTGV